MKKKKQNQKLAKLLGAALIVLILAAAMTFVALTPSQELKYAAADLSTDINVILENECPEMGDCIIIKEDGAGCSEIPGATWEPASAYQGGTCHVNYGTDPNIPNYPFQSVSKMVMVGSNVLLDAEDPETGNQILTITAPAGFSYASIVYGENNGLKGVRLAGSYNQAAVRVEGTNVELSNIIGNMGGSSLAPDVVDVVNSGNVLIEDSRFHGGINYGVNVAATNGLTIKDTLISDNAWSNPEFAYGLSLDADTSGVLVDGVIFRNNGFYNIFAQQDNYAPEQLEAVNWLNDPLTSVDGVLPGTIYPTANTQVWDIRNNANGGDCVNMGGNWDNGTLTCSFDVITEIIDMVEIHENDITLDGDPYGAGAKNLVLKNPDIDTPHYSDQNYQWPLDNRLYFTGLSNISLKGMSIDGTNVYGLFLLPLQMRDSSNITVSDSEIFNGGLFGTISFNGGSGLSLNNLDLHDNLLGLGLSASNITLDSLNVHDNVIGLTLKGDNIHLVNSNISNNNKYVTFLDEDAQQEVVLPNYGMIIGDPSVGSITTTNVYLNNNIVCGNTVMYPAPLPMPSGDILVYNTVFSADPDHDQTLASNQYGDSYVDGEENEITGTKVPCGGFANLCSTGLIDGSIDGIYTADPLADDAEVAICNDRNGDNVNDYRPSGNDVVFSAGFEKLPFYVDKWVSLLAFQKSIFNQNFNPAEGAWGTLGNNCNMLSALTSEYTASLCTGWEMMIDNASTLAKKSSEAVPVGAWDTDHASVLWYDDTHTLPSTLPSNTQIDTVVSNAADGWSIGTVVHGGDKSNFYTIDSGMGKDALTALENASVYKFTPTTPINVFCDGVGVSSTASDCRQVLFSAPGVPDQGRFEFYSIASGIPYLNGDFGLDDEQTGVSTAFGDGTTRNPICRKVLVNGVLQPLPGCDTAGETHHNADYSVETPHMIEAVNKADKKAFLDFTAAGFADYATADVLVNNGEITLTIVPNYYMQEMTNDIHLGCEQEDYLNGTCPVSPVEGRVRKMGLVMVGDINPEEIGNKYTIDGKNITGPGMAFSAFGEGKWDALSNNAHLSASTSLSVTNSNFNVLSFAADTNTPRFIDEVGTLIVQAASGSAEGGGAAISKIGGPLEVKNNTITNALDSASTIGQNARAALETNGKIFGDYVGSAIAYLHLNGRESYYNSGDSALKYDGVDIDGNIIKNAFAGISVYGGRTKIKNNNIQIKSNVDVEYRIQERAAMMYGPGNAGQYVYPDDVPVADGGSDAARTENFGGSYSLSGITKTCGYKNTVNESKSNIMDVSDDEQLQILAEDVYTRAFEEDTKGNYLNTRIGLLDHANCGATLISQNTLLGDGGVAFAIYSEATDNALKQPCNDSFFGEDELACSSMSNANYFVTNNTITGFENVAPVDEPGETQSFLPPHTPPTSNSLRPTPADGFDQCMVFVAPGLEELGKNIDWTTLPEPGDANYSDYFETVSMWPVDATSPIERPVIKGTPHFYIGGNTCGNNNGFENIGSGGIATIGSMVAFVQENEILGSQYVALVGAESLGTLLRTTVSIFGQTTLGRTFDAVMWWDHNNIVDPGKLMNTCTQDSIAQTKVGTTFPETITGSPGIQCSQLNSDIAILGVDPNFDVQTPGLAYVATNNTAKKIAVYLGSAATLSVDAMTKYFADIVSFDFVNNADNGTPASIEMMNGDDPEDTALQAAKTAFYDNVNTEYATVDVRCGVRGGLNQACPENTIIAAYKKSCAVKWYNDAADVIAHCGPLTTVETPLSIDSRFAHYQMYVPYGEIYLVATAPDMLDPTGLPINSNNPSLSVPTDTFANLIFAVKPDGKKQGMTTTKKLGSVLWVYQPNEVVWVDTVEYYPFVFESDSDWTVDVCLEVPEGYEIVEGESCMQTLVANEEKTILFKVKEVGSIPTASTVNFTFKSPNGKVIKEQMKINTRLSKELAKKKAQELLDAGYQIDEKGKLTKVK